MTTKRATIYDIAKTAGVSIGTVSRVMNGKDRVHPDTRARILAIAEQLRFQPSASARGLAMNRAHTIMMLVSDIANVYFAELAREINKASRTRGYRIILGDSDETINVEAEYLRTLLDRSVDGLIIAPLSTRANIPLYQDFVRRGFPLVMIDTDIEGVEVDCVKVDNERGGEMAVEYLHAKGHERIAFVSGDINFQTNRLRFQGYRSGLQRLGLPVCEEYFVLNQQFLESAGFGGVGQLFSLSKPPTAIFASSDLTAMACIHEVIGRGLRVPEDVAVVGFDNLAISSHMDIPLTTVAQPKDKVGGKAVELVLDRVENRVKTGAAARKILIEPTIVARNSA
jgi:LacI family transcriptional regulator